MKKKLLIAFSAFFFLFSINVMASPLSIYDLPGMLEKKDSAAFIQEYKGKDILVNGTLFLISDSDKDLIWLIVKIDEKSMASCPVPKENSNMYNDIKAGDKIILNGQVSSGGIWANKKNTLSLYLEKGCIISKR